MKINFKQYLKSFSSILDKRTNLVVILILAAFLIWGGLILYNSAYKKQVLTESIISKKKINQGVYQEIIGNLEKAQVEIDRAMAKEYPDPFK